LHSLCELYTKGTSAKVVGGKAASLKKLNDKNNMEILFLIGRILFGGFFIMNGLNHFMKNKMLAGYAASKGVPASSLLVYLSGLFILFGGLGILLGVYIQWAVALLVIFLLVVSFKIHNFWSIAEPAAKMSDMVNFTKNMALLGAALTLLAVPTPWPFSIF